MADVRARARDPRWQLGGVGVGFFVVALIAMGSMKLGWDESVYVSQVSPHAPAAYFSAPRTRGITWLVAPLVAVTPSVTALRVYLAALSSLALVLSFGTWLRVRRDASVPLAAGIFATLWTSMFYGAEVMPNLWIAFSSVTAVALALLIRREPTWPRLVGLAAAVAAAALLRPTDSVFLAAPIAVAALALPGWRRHRRAVAGVFAAMFVGGVLGSAPWLVESVTSYGGVVARLHEASEVQGGTGLQFSADLHLRAIDGPGWCRPCDRSKEPIPVAGTLWFLTGVTAAGIGLLAARRSRRTTQTALPLLVAASLALPYFFLIGYAAPRFLSPSFALAVLPVAQGLLAAPAWWPRRRALLRAGVVAVLVLHVAYQAAITFVVVRGNHPGREAWADIVVTLRENGVRPPCVVSGRAAPPIGFYAGCRSVQAWGPDRSATGAQVRRLSREQPTALILRASATRPRWARGWRVVPLRGEENQRWVAYVSPSARAG
ncbi:MAG: hypothetical protein M3Q27_17995 [Actinomycetota bacterium]|nr:hypothetical protein [Actinomycetota bacterium]